MATVIKNKQTSAHCGLSSRLYELLPPRLMLEAERLERIDRVEEIRVRRDRRASVTVGKRNIMLDYVFCGEEMDSLLQRVSGYSLYAHSDTVKNGYITLDGGIRVGIVGRAAVEDGQVIGVYDVSSMCFRLPHRITDLGREIYGLLDSAENSRGVLVYSPPGEGKTTLLRAIARRASCGERARRVAVIDTRDELCFSLDDETLCLDVMTGYPRPLGIEIATRTMNAQLIICDEIGDVEEAEAIISAQNCGVPFLASAHSDSVEALMKRSAIRRLHRARIFEYYVGIRRVGLKKTELEYDIADWEEADKYY